MSKCLFDIVVLVRWLFLFSCSFLQTHPFASITSLLHRVLRAPPCALKSPPISVCVYVCSSSSTCQCASGARSTLFLHVLVSVSRARDVYWGELQPELLLHDGDSCESRPRMLYFFDVFGPSLVDEYCCCVARFVVSCCCESASLLRRPQFFFLFFCTFR